MSILSTGTATTHYTSSTHLHPKQLQTTTKTLIMASGITNNTSDRLSALKQFEEAKTGVRGLVESNIAAVPAIFRHPILRPLPSSNHTHSSLSIPTIDISLPNSETVPLIASAARSCGFFQVINHGVPLDVISKALEAVRLFNELPPSIRSQFYSRGPNGGVNYNTNVDLYATSAASWRDTVQITMAPERAVLEKIPPVMREAVIEWDAAVVQVGRRLMELMSEGLGVGARRFEELSCLDGRLMVCHYYPPCPEPEKTVGAAEHKDPGVLTVLIQDEVGGLQVKWSGDGEDEEEIWVDVEPVPGALIINVGDFLQILSNDEYKSVEHRVLANSHSKARFSIAVFFNPGKRGVSDIYGPLPELVSDEKPARYRDLTVPEFMKAFLSKGLGSVLSNFKL